MYKEQRATRTKARDLITTVRGCRREHDVQGALNMNEMVSGPKRKGSGAPRTGSIDNAAEKKQHAWCQRRSAPPNGGERQSSGMWLTLVKSKLELSTYLQTEVMKWSVVDSFFEHKHKENWRAIAREGWGCARKRTKRGTHRKTVYRRFKHFLG